MADASFWTPVMLAVIPLSGVVGGFVAQSLIAGRNVYINSITAERSRWIEKLRSNLAAFHAAIDAFNLKSSLLSDGESTNTSLTDEDILEELARLDTLAATLQLQLNPQGTIDGNVIKLVETMNRFRHADGRGLHRLQHLLIEHSQWLLKAEWEKVKWEARGRFHRFLNRNEEARRLAKYAEWANGIGALEPVIAGLKTQAKREAAPPA